MNMGAFSPPMRRTAQLLLANEQGGRFSQLRVTPELPAIYKTLGAVVVHTVAVLESSSGRQILLPFINMMAGPAALAVSCSIYSIVTCTIFDVKQLTRLCFFYNSFMHACMHAG
jgi:hypothetical protein